MAEVMTIKDAIFEAKDKLWDLQTLIAEACKAYEKETGLKIQSPDGISLVYHGDEITGAKVRVALPFAFGKV